MLIFTLSLEETGFVFRSPNMFDHTNIFFAGAPCRTSVPRAYSGLYLLRYKSFPVCSPSPLTGGPSPHAWTFKQVPKLMSLLSNSPFSNSPVCSCHIHQGIISLCYIRARIETTNGFRVRIQPPNSEQS